MNELYSAACDIINNAIDLEQSKADTNIILKKYIEGRKVLLEALQVKATNEASVKLQEKMKNYLNKVQERIKTLSSSLDISHQENRNASLRKNSSVLKTLDRDIANMVLNQVLIEKPNVSWNDVSGLEEAKRALQELVILPSLRPDLYTGLRSPQRGLLLFGPPGTGKTMLAKAVAHEAKARFFSLSASSLLSKFYGESEKIIKTVFTLAKELQPSILFFDEVDSILSKRSNDEHEASRRLKTEFLLQFDGVGSGDSSRVIVLGATNRPQELDEATRRRFPRRIYVGLPEPETRLSILKNLLKSTANNLSSRDLNKLVQLTENYSCSDITALAKEAALYPLRDYTPQQLQKISLKEVRPVSFNDFKTALGRIRASVSKKEVNEVEQWAKEYGTSGA